MNAFTYRFLSLAFALLPASPLMAAEAEDRAKINHNWGKWGPDDEIGTLNYITPEVIRHAATLVKQGKVISMALPLEDRQPIIKGRQIQHFMIHTGQDVGNPRLQATDDHLSMPVHGTTHWDGLPHFFYERRLYNGYDVNTVTPYGARKLGIQNASEKVVTRGVFIDLPRYFGLAVLQAGHVILPEEIEAAARKQRVDFRQGDAILIRTGWLQVFYEKGQDAYLRNAPGIGWAATQWLSKVKASVVALDTAAGERYGEPPTQDRKGHPYQPRVAHYELLHNQGMMLGEMFTFEKLARDCATDGAYEFLFVAPPLNLTGGTGSPLNPQAIK